MNEPMSMCPCFNLNNRGTNHWIKLKQTNFSAMAMDTYSVRSGFDLPSETPSSKKTIIPLRTTLLNTYKSRKRRLISSASTSKSHSNWRSLGVDQSELCLDLTLPTGQSFRWRQTGDSEYTGVVDSYLFTLRQTQKGNVEYILHSYAQKAKKTTHKPYNDVDVDGVVSDESKCETDVDSLVECASKRTTPSSTTNADGLYFDTLKCNNGVVPKVEKCDDSSSITDMEVKSSDGYNNRSEMALRVSVPKVEKCGDSSSITDMHVTNSDGLNNRSEMALRGSVPKVEKYDDSSYITDMDVKTFDGLDNRAQMALRGSVPKVEKCDDSSYSTDIGEKTSAGFDNRAELALRDYLNLDTSLKDIWAPFILADARFADLAPHLAGARLLRQRPLECLFEFICSSNNHIQRITQMVDHLASFGPYLGSVKGIAFHAFPTLDDLEHVTEDNLRAAGFGYRAKYIVGTVKALQCKKCSGEEWLYSLRSTSLDEAVESLCTLPGIGPKVAACIALFSLDQHHAIPVDTHVWQIATRYITPELAGERLTPKLHAAVSEAFVKRFGEYAGWAQNVLFIAELASHQHYLPEDLRAIREKKPKKKITKKGKGKEDI